MSETPTPQQTGTDPLDLLKELGGPSRQEIEAMKGGVPNHRLKIVAPDKKRAFVVRAISALELKELMSRIPENASNKDLDEQILVVTRATMWTNVGNTQHKLDEQILRAGAAGTPSMLFTVIMELSDFLSPEYVAQSMSAEL